MELHEYDMKKVFFFLCYLKGNFLLKCLLKKDV